MAFEATPTDPALLMQPDYTPTGELAQLDTGLPAYRTGSGSLGILVVPDTFGFPSGPDFTGPGARQVLQVAERLAAASGSVVLVLDMFRGQPWPLHKVPPKPHDRQTDWLAAHTYEKFYGDVDIGVAYLKGRGAHHMAILGISWGATVAFGAATRPDQPFSAVGAVHPEFFNEEAPLVAPVKCPVILLCVDGDPMECVQAITDTKPFAKDCLYHRFKAVPHGFCGGVGDWSQPGQAAAAAEAVVMLANFFSKQLM